MSGLLVTVEALVVSLGDDERLHSCLEALRAQEGVRIHVVLVQNAATGPGPGLGGPDSDGVGGSVAAVTRVRRPGNDGFAAAFDDAFAVGSAELVASVNPDCRLDPDALLVAARCLDRTPRAGAVAFFLRRPEGVIDSEGIVLDAYLWRARDRGRGVTGGAPTLGPGPVDAACLAGALLRRSALERARDGAGDVLDRRYFAYQEDVDLGWRLRRCGAPVIYEPGARGTHERGWREGVRRTIPVALRRHSVKNRGLTILKNASYVGLFVRLPLLLLFEAALILYLVLREPAVLPAYVDLLGEAGPSFARRRLRCRSKA